MPSPDQPTTSPTPSLPTPPSGVGASDLKTDSSDPQELRDLLDRARERLVFYESFDRIIGENIRRSGELMVETVALREQAQKIANQSAKERAEFEATREADRDRYRALIQHALDEAATVRPVIDALMTRLQGVMDELADDTGLQRMDPELAPPTAAQAVDPVSVSTTSDLVEPWSTSARETAEIEAAGTSSSEEPPSEEPVEPAPKESARQPEADIPDIPTADEDAVPDKEQDAATETDHEEVTAPRIIDVLAHGVPNARVAISLQKMLRGLDVVSNVEAREFADGELRLSVTATDALPMDALRIWLTDNRGELTSTSDSVTEITFLDT